MTIKISLLSTVIAGAALTACVADDEAGIANGSFEVEGENYVYAVGWVPDLADGGCSASRTDGTGFMPTNGSWYIHLQAMESPNWWACTEPSLYQEPTSLTGLTTLVFDYALSGNADAANPATARLLFTGNGTVTLWSRDFVVGDNSVEQLDETVAIPADLPTGKLSIQLYRPYANPNTSSGIASFEIDNLRVE